MSASDTTAPLNDIVITAALADRPAFRDPAVELAALKDLLHQYATEPSGLIEHVVDVALQQCGVGSAGLSLLEPGTARGDGVFRWVAVAGALRHYTGRTAPELFSPRGLYLSHRTPQLFARPARVFTELSQITPEIVEALVVPFCSSIAPDVSGAIWIVSHDARQLTKRELAIMIDLANFTGPAMEMQCARDQAEAADRAKGEFLAVVSHELRRPVTAMVGWSELLMSGRSTPATAARAITAIRDSARRQQAMIEDLLDGARTLTGTLRLNEMTMDLAAVVHSAVDIVADTAQERGVELSATTDRSVPIHGDPDRIHQIVGNLLNNAVKFTPPGGRVSVSVRVVPEAIEIVVCDTGSGIAPHIIPVIFDAFRQGNASSTRRQSGLGLGLTIARHLTALHKGTIEAHSDGEGCGSRFIVRLPVHRLRAGGLSATPPISPHRQTLDGVAVLAVDDEPDVRDMLAVALGNVGASVFTASNVEDALYVLSSQSIDVLVTDIAMPGQDGYDLLARLKRNHSVRVPRTAIAVTALAAERARHRVLAAGFDHYVAKPVDLHLLVSLIAKSARRQDAR